MGCTSTKNTKKSIGKLLKKLGFDVEDAQKPMTSDLKKAVSTYHELRNAVFHRGELTTEVDTKDKGKIKVELSNYLFHFSALVALVVLKVVGFDDNHINWNCWIDHMPFK